MHPVLARISCTVVALADRWDIEMLRENWAIMAASDDVVVGCDPSVA